MLVQVITILGLIPTWKENWPLWAGHCSTITVYSRQIAISTRDFIDKKLIISIQESVKRMQAENFATPVSGNPSNQELGKCGYVVYNLPESLRNREVLTMCEEMIHHEGAGQRNFAPDVSGHQMITGTGKKNPGQHSLHRYTSKEKQREYKLRWQAKQNPEKLKEKNREYCRKYKQKQKELESLLSQSANTSNHINNDSFSNGNYKN